MIHDLGVYVAGVVSGVVVAAILGYAWIVSSLTNEDLQP